MAIYRASEEEITRIHEASLWILRKTGVEVRHEATLEDLARIGCEVEGKRVRIGEGIVQRVLGEVVQGFDIYGRSGGRKVAYRAGELYFRPAGGPPFVIDRKTGKRRNGTLADAADFARLLDALPNFAIANPTVSTVKEATGIANVHRFVTSIQYSEKPNDITTTTGREVKAFAEIARLVRGGAKALAKQPLTVVYVSPVSPLTFNQEQVEAILAVAGEGLPLAVLPCPTMGATAPITIAGAVAQQNAETLAGLVIASLAGKRLVPVYCSRIFPLDLRTGLSAFGSPESGMTTALAAQLAARYGLPSNGYGFATTAKRPDGQACYEKMFSGFVAALGGTTMLSGGGSLDDALTTSFEQMVIDNEIAGEIKRAMRGFEVNEETLGLEAIERVAAGGDFLSDEHTVAHLRTGDIFLAELGERLSFAQWEREGSRSIEERAREKVDDILGSHVVAPLERGLQKAIDEVIAHAQREVEGRR